MQLMKLQVAGICGLSERCVRGAAERCSVSESRILEWQCAATWPNLGTGWDAVTCLRPWAGIALRRGMLRACPRPHPCWTDSTGDGVLAHGRHARTRARLCPSGPLPPRPPQPQAAAPLVPWPLWPSCSQQRGVRPGHRAHVRLWSAWLCDGTWHVMLRSLSYT